MFFQTECQTNQSLLSPLVVLKALNKNKIIAFQNSTGLWNLANSDTERYFLEPLYVLLNFQLHHRWKNLMNTLLPIYPSKKSYQHSRQVYQRAWIAWKYSLEKVKTTLGFSGGIEDFHNPECRLYHRRRKVQYWAWKYHISIPDFHHLRNKSFV